MSFRRFRSALPILFAAACAALPAHADNTFTTERFAITFSDGWQSAPGQSGSDSALALMYGYSMMGYCFMAAGPADQASSAGDLDAYRQLGGGDSVVKVAEGSRALGGKDFAFVEYRNADTSEGDIRIRIYSASQGGVRFNSALIYDNSVADVMIPEMETALATLSFSGTPIRIPAARAPLARHPAARDILGRSGPLALHAVRFLPAER